MNKDLHSVNNVPQNNEEQFFQEQCQAVIARYKSKSINPDSEYVIRTGDASGVLIFVFLIGSLIAFMLQLYGFAAGFLILMFYSFYTLNNMEHFTHVSDLGILIFTLKENGTCSGEFIPFSSIKKIYKSQRGGIRPHYRLVHILNPNSEITTDTKLSIPNGLAQVINQSVAAGKWTGYPIQ